MWTKYNNILNETNLFIDFGNFVIKFNFNNSNVNWSESVNSMIWNARDLYEFCFDPINSMPMPTDNSLVTLSFLWKYSLITFACICSKNRSAHTFQTKSKDGKLIWYYSPEATRKKHYHFILLTMEIVSRKMNCSKAFGKIWILHWYK